MSSAVFAVRAFLANLLLLPLTPLYQSYFRRDTDRNHEIRIGDCRFCGPESFTWACRSAMEELRLADEDLFTALTSSGPITFWLKSPEIRGRIYNKISRFYAVDPAYFAWGPRGIVAFVIAIHFDEMYTRRLFCVPVETLFAQMAYKGAAVEWLNRRNYPAELVEPLRLRESPT